MVKKLSAYIKGYEKSAWLAPLLCILEVLCELCLPLLMARIINYGIQGDGGMQDILKTGALMVCIALGSMASGVLAAKFAATASQGFGANLRRAIFNHVQTFSFADIDRFSSASLITRMTNDVNTIQMTFNMSLRIVTRAPVMLLAALVVCVKINRRLTLLLLGVILVMSLLIGLLIRMCSKLFVIYQTKIDALNHTVQENLIAIRAVKAFVRATHEKQKLRAANDALMQAGIRASGRVVLHQPIMMLSFYAAIIGVLWVGGQDVMQGVMPIGDLASFIAYIAQILMSVIMLAMSLIALTRAIACVRRVVEVLDTVPSIEDAADALQMQLPAAKGKIEFLDASFRYTASGTGDDVLSHIHLTIEPGEFVAIIGGTGVGKSSLVNLIPRFYDVTGGEVRIDGKNVKEYPIAALRQRIGMVLQNNVLFSGTIRENLCWGRENADDAALLQAVTDAQAYNFIQALPDGFETHIEQGGVNLSGGQKQRLCIARAMLRKPAILILDDSTSAVDSTTESAIRTSFRQNFKDTTVVLIAQRISSVQYADKIVILDDDHIAGMGTHETLLAENKIYQEIYQSQQEGGCA